ncbi:MAG: PRC-barrel domain containing protein [Ignavibacteriae bacterium]|nr:MAG: PRC-barrel domain containing protein [Ignavibacteriota bacterium]
MLRRLSELVGYNIIATDAEIGKVADFYFDDLNWTIRYMIAETGGWLSGKKVMISPFSLGYPNWNDKKFPLKLTKEQIENSPGIGVDEPVSRQYETELTGYYGWPAYWSGSMGIFSGVDGVYGPINIPPPAEMERNPEIEAEKKALQDTETHDPHLRSLDEVKGYKIHASDGKIGHVEDFIVDDENWMIRYMLVDTKKWFPGGKHVLIAPYWIEAIDWDESEVKVNLTEEKVKNSPELDESQPINRQYESELFDYYSKPRYWEK